MTAALVLIAQLTCVASPTAPALDHVIIAVRDLEQSAGSFRRLGFTIKHGRQHANNLLNRHIKFRDGSELELMTVNGAPVDSMAQTYADLLRHGDGGVYVALKARSVPQVQEAASALALRTRHSVSGPWQFISFATGSPAGAVFFGFGDFRVQDTDSILTHRPPVKGLVEAWVEADSALGSLLEKLGAQRCETLRAPDGRSGQRWALGRGSLVIVPPASPTIKRVLGVVLATTAPVGAIVHPLPNFWVRYHAD